MVHLQENGFEIESVDLSEAELIQVKQQRGVPEGMASCHTAEIGGYIVEGHVPSVVIEKMLAEKPEIVGLAVPGMPEGSPGMGGELSGPMEIFAFDRAGDTWVYVEYMDGILE